MGRLPLSAALSIFASMGATHLFGQAPGAVAAHRTKAQEYLSEKQPKLPIAELLAVAAVDPSDAETRANLGVLEFFAGQYSAAESQLKFAVAAKPDLWRILALLGIAERRVGDDPAGRADLEKTLPHLEDEKLKVTVGRDLIESCASSEDYEKAAGMIARLLRLEPTNPTLLYISYRIHTQMATAAMLELGLATPDSAEIHQAIAHELQRDKNLPATIANLRKAIELEPSLPGAHFELGEALHASDDQRLRAEAEAEYKLAIAANPSDTKALTRLGDLEVERGDLAAAELNYRQALKVQPDAVDAAIGVANVLTEQGHTEEAAPLLVRLEAAEPSNYLVHYRLSAVYRRLKRPEDVKREVEPYPRYKDLHEKLAKVYRQMRVLTTDDDGPVSIGKSK